MSSLVINSTEELPMLVKQILDYAGDRKKFVLIGEIGAGKTTFTKAFCDHLGVVEEASSPTFSLINEYEYTDAMGKVARIYHADLYRLKDIEEALDIGIEEYLDNDSYFLIEWPEIIEPLLPEDCIRIKLEIIGNSNRKILFL
ncbi:MAG: tRNA (adenosine(37)-N6)-threonylcarbamoyltransferase complex ATPase subunit type 1 TsaE [Chitinophagales bacterium]|nr:tRNA (adenosine(37)-N6)-threonylcarbamoyltransferase complex ATPase subunit type 1 TsaE [Chitinophagales bacterium]